jgi:hypothetical protein
MVEAAGFGERAAAIIALLGPDLQAGIGGFGDTAAEALRDLACQMEFENHRLPGIDF